MTTMVCFRSAGAAYCITVQATRGVRPADGIIALPAPDPDVAGIVPGDPPLTVIAPFGANGSQILIVDTVTGLRRVPDADIRPAPDGQDRALICGTVDAGDALVLVADPDAIAARL
jgi:chemotaxis signal transduction protein